jgi:hypothetical protein
METPANEWYGAASVGPGQTLESRRASGMKPAFHEPDIVITLKKKPATVAGWRAFY